MTAEEISQSLGGTRSDSGKWRAPCPAHTDRVASLSITDRESKILFHCHAGCSQASVLAALKELGLWPDRLAHRRALHAASKATKVIAAAYPYRDEHGTLLFEVVRYKPKDFRQRRPDGVRGWNWKLDGVRRVPYRLPELLAAHRDAQIFIAEGEKDVDNLVKLDFVATTNAGGAGKWLSEFADFFRDRKVAILPDNDISGQMHVRQVAASLLPFAREVKFVQLPNLPKKGDVSDWLAAGGTREQLLELVGASPTVSAADLEAEPVAAGRANGSPPCDESKPASERERGRESQSTTLVKIALANGTLFHDSEDCFATVQVREHIETHGLHGRAFRRWLAFEYFRANETAPNAESLSAAINTLAGVAAYRSAEKKVYVRVAQFEGKVYLDLCSTDWRVVQVAGDGWQVIDATDCPVRFRRAHGMQELPDPVPGGRTVELASFLNVAGDDLKLVTAWLVAALRNRGPYPILVLQGEQGTAKSTAARVLRELIDPNAAPLRVSPREPRDLMIAANNSWIISLDNLSIIPDWLSDALCRLATGGGLATRSLYTDADEQIFNAQRPTILNGIEELTTRGDLLDRSIVVYLARIPETRRQTEAVFWESFYSARPRLLGAFLDVTSCAIRNAASITLDWLPRMADFALWIEAAAPALNWSRNEFLRAYVTSQRAANDLALESAVAEAICRVALPWFGTATGLLHELEQKIDDRSRTAKSWPSSGQSLSNRLRRLAPNLLSAGVNVQFTRPGGKRTIALIPADTVGKFAAHVASAAQNRQMDGGSELFRREVNADSRAASRDDLTVRHTAQHTENPRNLEQRAACAAGADAILEASGEVLTNPGRIDEEGEDSVDL